MVVVNRSTRLTRLEVLRLVHEMRMAVRSLMHHSALFTLVGAVMHCAPVYEQSNRCRIRMPQDVDKKIICLQMGFVATADLELCEDYQIDNFSEACMSRGQVNQLLERSSLLFVFFFAFAISHVPTSFRTLTFAFPFPASFSHCSSYPLADLVRVKSAEGLQATLLLTQSTASGAATAAGFRGMWSRSKKAKCTDVTKRFVPGQQAERPACRG